MRTLIWIKENRQISTFVLAAALAAVLTLIYICYPHPELRGICAGVLILSGLAACAVAMFKK